MMSQSDVVVRRTGLALVIGLLLLASCGSDGRPASQTSEILGTSMLELIPADGAPLEVRFGDVSLAAERSGLTAPRPGENAETFFDELRSSGAFFWFGSLSPFLDRPEDWRPIVGVEPVQIAQGMGVTIGPFWFDMLHPIEPIDLNAIEEAASLDPLWFEDMQRVETPFGEYLDWNVDNDDAVDASRAGGIRSIGRAGQVGIADETIVWSASSFYVEQALRVASSDEPRLGDNELIVELLSSYEGPPVQAFWLSFSPANGSVQMVLNVPSDDGYAAIALVIDSSVPLEPSVSSAAGPARIERVGDVVRLDLDGQRAFRTLVDCAMAGTCFELN